MKTARIVLIILFVGFWLGFIRGYFLLQDYEPLTEHTELVFTQPPIDKGKYIKLPLKTKDGNQHVVVFANKEEGFAVHDVIKLTKINEIEYRSGVHYVYYPQIELVGTSNQDINYRAQINNLRKGVINHIDSIYKEPYAALVNGIIFGIDRPVSSTLDKSLRASGIIHIIVASGYNITVLVAISMFLLVNLKGWYKWSLIIISIILYVLISGIEPPIARAAVMAFVSIYTLIKGKQYHSLLVLIYTAIIMIFISPGLIYSISFQLSFAASLGIILFYRQFEELFILMPRLMREDFVATMSAQLFTMPIIWVHLGVFQPIGLVTNLLVLWIVPIVMGVGIISLVFGLFSHELGVLVSYPVELLLKYLVYIIEIFS